MLRLSVESGGNGPFIWELTDSVKEALEQWKYSGRPPTLSTKFVGSLYDVNGQLSEFVGQYFYGHTIL